MTTTMAAAICAAIDADTSGTDDALNLAALADCLEDEGVVGAAVVRSLNGKRPLVCLNHCRWDSGGEWQDRTVPHGIERRLLDHMTDGELHPEGAKADDLSVWYHWREFPTRSAAFLALSAALAETAANS